MNITSIKGIGEKKAQDLRRIGIESVEDLLEYFPRDYESYEEPVPIGMLSGCDKEVKSVVGRITSGGTVRRVKGMVLVTAYASDPSGKLAIYYFNAAFMKSKLVQGQTFIFRGRVSVKGKQISMAQPEIFTPEEYMEKAGRLLPIYPLSKNITNNMLEKAVAEALEISGVQGEFLPLKIRRKYHLSEYSYAIRNIHFPETKDDLLFARKRLVFDEFFLFILALRRLKEREERLTNSFCIKRQDRVDAFVDKLPYKLTGAQKKVWAEIRQDLSKPYVMSRLVQGDVGSGKTIVALLALLDTAISGYQGALMAPTEVLARQHMESISRMVEEYGLPVVPALLTGAMTAKERRIAFEKIASGEANIIIGTHALIQEKVEYHELALVVTDEQHRFGVRQREIFQSKGEHPHILVMSATPIPRTLAIILYGDLDISVIDELPANRLPIKNCVVTGSYRKTAYQFIEKEVRAGHQVYIICPMVEDSEFTEDLNNVVDYEKELKQFLPSDITTGILHGKMKSSVKNDVMERFLNNEIQVLVSTTVVEVGVNVPNATVMMVENAERFGLAQLHQLRGRVGRGSAQSYCIFISDTKSADTRKRLETLNKSNDGFFIASEDLKLRGPGDMFGIRQSGVMEFKVGDVFTDASILKEASECVDVLLEDDPLLEKMEHFGVLKKLSNYGKTLTETAENSIML